MTETPEETKETLAQRNDRDGYYKMAVLALTANYWAHNTPIPPEQIVEKAGNLAEMLWDNVVAYRKRKDG